MVALESSRLARVISPLRRSLLRAARGAEGLPDIPDAQIEVLRALPAGSSRSPGELAEALRLNRSTISNLLRTMSASGLVTRHPSTHDRRSNQVQASPRAVELLRRFDGASDEVVDRALAAVGDADRAAIGLALPALERLHRALEEVSAVEAAFTDGETGSVAESAAGRGAVAETDQ